MNKAIINIDKSTEKISRHIYGHFAEHLGRCIYDGIWVGKDSPIPNTRGIRNDIVEALRKIKIPNLRWPGGCFADTYHWMDGIGPYEKRPTIINTHWGGVVENNHFGTHEFLDLCEQLECEPYICGNVGSGTVREMQEWIEYMNFDGSSTMADLRRNNGQEKPWEVRFWGVGNENWGCGGNMTPEYYADVYKRFQTYCRNYSGINLYKIACGFDEKWNEVLMQKAGGNMHGLSIHHYSFTGRWDKKGSAIEFEENEWFSLLKSAFRINDILIKNITIMDKYDPKKKVGLIVDEWGTWYDVEPDTNPGFLYQQNTMRDALVAGLTLNIFNQYCDRVKIANIAQTINVLQAMVLTKDEKMLLTPTYHVFEMYKVHHDAALLPMELKSGDYKYKGNKIPAVNGSASMNENGKIHISLCHTNPNKETEINIEVKGKECKEVTGRILAGSSMNAHNTFDSPDTVVPSEYNGAKLEGNKLMAKLPPMSVIVLEIK